MRAPRAFSRDYCLLPADASRADTHHLNCGPGGHPHLTFTEIYGTKTPVKVALQLYHQQGAAYRGYDGLLERGEIQWLCFPTVLCCVLHDSAPGQTPLLASGASARFGPFVAAELARTSAYARRQYDLAPLEVGPPEPLPGRLALAWPHLFVAQIRRQRIAPEKR